MVTKNPTGRNRRATTERILAAATDVFSTIGYDKATTKLIAEKANVSEALIIRYFQSKQNLLDEIIHQFNKDIDELSLSYPAQELLGDEIQQFASHLLKFFSAKKKEYKIITLNLMLNKKLAKGNRSKIMERKYFQQFERRMEHFNLSAKFSRHQITFIILFYVITLCSFGDSLLSLSSLEMDELLKMWTNSFSQGLRES